MSNQYDSVYYFLSSSLLQVNDSKTHPMLLTTAQMRRSRNLSLTVKIGAVEQEANAVERLLGLHLHQDLKFREHIMDNEKSLLKSLNTRLKALMKIKQVTSFPQRLAIANGIFYSKVVFLISVWGGTVYIPVNVILVWYDLLLDGKTVNTSYWRKLLFG